MEEDPSGPFSGEAVHMKSLDGMDKEFSVASVWDNIRPRGTSVYWHDVVWFTCCIPRHTFNLWLVIKRKLKNQDSLRQWDVWNHMKSYVLLPSVVASLDSIVTYLIPISRKRCARSVIAKLFKIGVPLGRCTLFSFFMVFPSSWFFLLGFSWEGFLRRQSPLVFYTPDV
nr:hypothetical protein [Tanacetum cinerariifolium]